MHAHLGDKVEAERWNTKAEAYRKRANELLWDGTKYLHHVHLDDIDHGDFDESKQLAMGNTWAVTRGLATPQQARSIIDEYRRRHKETGDAYPWWSLQPGYPDHLGYFKQPHCQQGGYANGGLMPWVGGELCRAAFRSGRELYGVELLRTYAKLLKRDGGVHVWYWLNGKPGFRTTNEVSYPPWGMAEWLHATIEGLAGVHDDDGQFRTVTVSPRWAAANVRDASVSVRYAASKAYFAYHMETDKKAKTIRLTCTGSGSQTNARVLLPNRWKLVNVTQGGTTLKHWTSEEDTSRYACFIVPVSGVRPVVIQCVRTVSN